MLNFRFFFLNHFCKYVFIFTSPESLEVTSGFVLKGKVCPLGHFSEKDKMVFKTFVHKMNNTFTHSVYEQMLTLCVNTLL